jgi:hypothetical protein
MSEAVKFLIDGMPLESLFGMFRLVGGQYAE